MMGARPIKPRGRVAAGQPKPQAPEVPDEYFSEKRFSRRSTGVTFHPAGISTEMSMRKIKALLAAGISSAAIIGFAGLANAESPVVHTMTVQLPGGGVETIRYTGDVAPKIVVAPASSAMPAMPTFVAFDQIAAQMDRQMDVMMQQARAMQMMPMMGDINQLMQAAARSGGGGFCAQSMSITSMGNGQPAKVVTHSAGNCGGHAPATGGGQANDVQVAPDFAKPIPIKTTAPAPHPIHQHI
jgi:hypothetical protein